MSFLMMTGIYNSGIGLLITGIVFIAGGIWLKMAVDKLIVDTCSITSFILGFILLAIWLSSLVIIAAIMYVIYILLALFKMPPGKEKTIIYALSFVLLLSTAMSPAISGALLIILLAFMVNHKTGFAVGIISFIYFVSQYYYDLGYTLLVKSVLMFSTGILFMLIYLFTYKKLHTNEKI